MGNKKSKESYSAEEGLSELGEDEEKKVLNSLGEEEQPGGKKKKKKKLNRKEAEAQLELERQLRIEKEKMYEQMRKENEELRLKQEELMKKITVISEEKEEVEQAKEKITEAFMAKSSEFNDAVDKLEEEKKELGSKINKFEKNKLRSMKSKSKRSGILRQFFISEKQYCEKLSLLKEYYVEQLRERGLANPGSMIMLFQNFENLVKKNRAFVRELERILFVGSTDDYLLDVFLKFFMNFEEYFGYISGFKASFDHLLKLHKNNKKFRRFIQKMAKGLKRSEKVSTMIGLMLLPIQRLHRYRKVVTDLMEYTNKETRAKHYGRLEGCLEKVAASEKIRDEQSQKFEDVLQIVQINVELKIVLDPLSHKFLLDCKAKRTHEDGIKKCKLIVLNGVMVCVEKMEDGGKLVELYQFKKNTKVLDNHALLECEIEFPKRGPDGFRVGFEEDEQETYQKFVRMCRNCLDYK